MTPLELDFLRSKLIEESRELAALLFMRRYEYDFSGRPSCVGGVPCPIKEPCTLHRLERMQWQFDELRALYVTTKSERRVRDLARALPRFAAVLSRAATGWRDHRGNVHRHAADNPRPDPCTYPKCDCARALQPDGTYRCEGIELGDRCAHGRPWSEPCGKCAADDAERDAL